MDLATRERLVSPSSIRVDYLCWNEDCVGIGRWTVLVDAATREPLDERDSDCPTCGDEGQPA